MSHIYDKYTKVVDAEFPRMSIHASIPAGAPLSVVFDHYRLQRDRRNEWRKQVNLFFVSGTGMTKCVWRYHIKKLFEYSEREGNNLPWQIVNCVAMDNVNHGDSAVENAGRLGWEFDWREGAHDLIQVAKSLRLTGDSVVVGHSMGGFQALYASSISPLLFKFVVAIEPVTHGSPEQSQVFKAKFLKALNKIVETDFPDEEAYINYMKKKSFYRNFQPEILNDLIESEKIVHRDGTVSTKTSKAQQMICYYSGVKQFKKGLTYIEHIEVPVVHVVGAKASWNPAINVDQVNKALKDGECITVQEGQHLLNCERPDELIEIILSSLRKHITKKEPTLNENLNITKAKYEEIFNYNYKKLDDLFKTKNLSKL